MCVSSSAEIVSALLLLSVEWSMPLSVPAVFKLRQSGADASCPLLLFCRTARCGARVMSPSSSSSSNVAGTQVRIVTAALLLHSKWGRCAASPAVGQVACMRLWVCHVAHHTPGAACHCFRNHPHTLLPTPHCRRLPQAAAG